MIQILEVDPLNWLGSQWLNPWRALRADLVDAEKRSLFCYSLLAGYC